MGAFMQCFFFVIVLLTHSTHAMSTIQKFKKIPKNSSRYFYDFKSFKFPSNKAIILQDSDAQQTIKIKQRKDVLGFNGSDKHNRSHSALIKKNSKFFNTREKSNLTEQANSAITAIEHPELTIIPEYFPKGMRTAKSSQFFKTTSKIYKKPYPLERSSFAFNKFSHVKRMFSTQSTPSQSVDLSLSGDAASLMNPKSFKILLNSNGKTVADCVRLDCEKETQKSFKQIRQRANLSDFDWMGAQNTMNLKEQWLKRYASGNYNEKNIIFEDAMHPFIVRTIKDSFKKANIPFKVVVSLQENVDYAAAVAIEFGPKQFPFSYTLKSGAVDLIEADVTMHLHLNAQYWTNNTYPVCESCVSKSEQCLALQSTLAHETVHLLLLHPLERLHLTWYLENIKKVDARTLEECLDIMEKLHEYLADISILADPFYAQAQKHRFSTHKNVEGSSMNISNALGYKLASLAVDLHTMK